MHAFVIRACIKGAYVEEANMLWNLHGGVPRQADLVCVSAVTSIFFFRSTNKMIYLKVSLQYQKLLKKPFPAYKLPKNVSQYFYGDSEDAIADRFVE